MFEHLVDTSFTRQTRMGLMETDVFLQPHLPDGKVVWMGMRWLHIGTGPLSLMEEARRDIRMIVRNGLAGVLEQLGEYWYDEPTGREIFESLRAGSQATLNASRKQEAA